MDDFNGEVSCTEVLGIEPGEQALTHSFTLAVAGRAGTPFSERANLCLPVVSVRTPRPCCCNSPS